MNHNAVYGKGSTFFEHHWTKIQILLNVQEQMKDLPTNFVIIIIIIILILILIILLLSLSSSLLFIIIIIISLLDHIFILNHFSNTHQ